MPVKGVATRVNSSGGVLLRSSPASSTMARTVERIMSTSCMRDCMSSGFCAIMSTRPRILNTPWPASASSVLALCQLLLVSWSAR
jgi:hypothetical protein